MTKKGHRAGRRTSAFHGAPRETVKLRNESGDSHRRLQTYTVVNSLAFQLVFELHDVDRLARIEVDAEAAASREDVFDERRALWVLRGFDQAHDSNVAGIRDLGGRLDVLIFDQSRENFGLLVFGQSLDGGECLCNRECRMSHCLVPNVLCWR